MKKNVLDFTFEELESYITQKLEMKKFRATQIADWIYKKHVYEFDNMKNISKDDRYLLNENLYIGIPEIKAVQESKIDGTTKFLFELEDGSTVESVILFYPNRVSACISTQVGCALKCKFCSTGASGFVRDMTAGEIVSQILAMEEVKDININNIVYMGMGEPFLNYDNVIKSIKILNDKKMKCLGGRHITVSTSGIVEKIEELGDLPIEVRLSVSLHAPNNEIRDKLMPINNKYPIEQVIQGCKDYQEKTNKRVTMEYIMIRGLNDSEENARELAKLIQDLKVMVNLIPVNPNPAGYERPSKKFIDKFAKILIENGIDVTIRAEKGTDIDAACGQLRRRNERK